MEVHDGSRPPEPKDDTSTIDEAMWRLRLGGGEHDPLEVYPERPEEADCIYYLRTGFCRYGSRCRFNHPHDRIPVSGASRAGSAEFLERNVQPVCQFYMRTGACKFGSSCKYHHQRQQGLDSNGPIPLNYYGYPYRPEKKECSYYMKTGHCKFGETCKFNHPQLAGVPVAASSPQMPLSFATPAPYTMVQSPPIPSSQQYGVLVMRPPIVPSFVQSLYSPMLLSPGIAPFTGYAPYQASVSPAASSSPQAGSGSNLIYGLSQSVDPSTGYKEQLFPKRPGQPECQHYLKTGDCKYGSSCRYHHPSETNAIHTSAILNPLVLPLRLGVAPCMHFARGECKFGPTCKFDHSMGALSYSSSAYSLGDAPVIPYPGILPYMNTPYVSPGAVLPSMVSAPYPTTQRLNHDSATSLGTRNGHNSSSKAGTA